MVLVCLRREMFGDFVSLEIEARFTRGWEPTPINASRQVWGEAKLIEETGVIKNHQKLRCN